MRSDLPYKDRCPWPAEGEQMESAGRFMEAVVNAAVMAGGWEEVVLGESAWSERGHRLDLGDDKREPTEWAIIHSFIR